MGKEKKQLRLWQGLLVIILAGLEVFVFSDFLPQWLGMGRSLIGELILLGTAVGAVAVFGGKFRSVFPIHKPKLTEVMGTILIYLGASQAISVVTMIEMYIAPEMVTETSIGLSSMFISSSMIVAIIVVGIAPAICKEAVFRGVFFNSIWNQTTRKMDSIFSLQRQCLRSVSWKYHTIFSNIFSLELYSGYLSIGRTTCFIM